MPKKLKYRKGRLIRNLAHLEICLNYGTWIYMRDRPKHPKVIEAMTIWTVKRFIEGNALHEAIFNKEV